MALPKQGSEGPQVDFAAERCQTPQDMLPETCAHIDGSKVWLYDYARQAVVGFMHQTCCVVPARQAKALLHVLYSTHWAGEISN